MSGNLESFQNSTDDIAEDWICKPLRLASIKLANPPYIPSSSPRVAPVRFYIISDKEKQLLLVTWCVREVSESIASKEATLLSS